MVRDALDNKDSKDALLHKSQSVSRLIITFIALEYLILYLFWRW